MDENPYEATQSAPEEQMARADGRADKAWFGVACLVIGGLWIFGYESSGFVGGAIAVIFFLVGAAYLLASIIES